MKKNKHNIRYKKVTEGSRVGMAQKEGRNKSVNEGLKTKEGAGNVRSCKYTFAQDVAEMGRDGTQMKEKTGIAEPPLSLFLSHSIKQILSAPAVTQVFLTAHACARTHRMSACFLVKTAARFTAGAEPDRNMPSYSGANQ